MQLGWACAPGTCGELVQGSLDGIDFHITFPVDIRGRVEVGWGPAHRSDQNTVVPESLFATKMKRAIDLVLAQGGKQPADRSIVVKRWSNPLPRGKGMASSTVDICAGIYAAAALLGYRPSLREVAELALAVEPSDGLFLPGISLFDHRHGRVMQVLGSPVKLDVVVLDCGGTVDTGQFNARGDLTRLNRMKESDVCRAVDLVERGLRNGDAAAVAAGATLSALAHQAILPKPNLESLVEKALALGALGINAAHSGTVIGVLFPSGFQAADEVVRELTSTFREYKFLCQTRMVGGGVRWGTRDLSVQTKNFEYLGSVLHN